jgi:hypothetical protein
MDTQGLLINDFFLKHGVSKNSTSHKNKIFAQEKKCTPKNAPLLIAT